MRLYSLYTAILQMYCDYTYIPLLSGYNNQCPQMSLIVRCDKFNTHIETTCIMLHCASYKQAFIYYLSPDTPVNTLTFMKFCSSEVFDCLYHEFLIRKISCKAVGLLFRNIYT